MLYSQNLKNLDWKLDECTGPNSVDNYVDHIIHMKPMALVKHSSDYSW